MPLLLECILQENIFRDASFDQKQKKNRNETTVNRRNFLSDQLIYATTSIYRLIRCHARNLLCGRHVFVIR